MNLCRNYILHYNAYPSNYNIPINTFQETKQIKKIQRLNTDNVLAFKFDNISQFTLLVTTYNLQDLTEQCCASAEHKFAVLRVYQRDNVVI